MFIQKKYKNAVVEVKWENIILVKTEKSEEWNFF
jgi:hypothetical protein